MSEHDSVAELFVMQAIQEWGQSDADRIAAVDGVLKAAGFEARAVGFPVFGGIWTKSPPAEGADGASASEWVNALLEEMPRGHFEDERDHVVNAIVRRLESRDVMSRIDDPEVEIRRGAR